MTCQQCGADVAPSANFCAACGAVQPIVSAARAQSQETKPPRVAAPGDWSALSAWRPQLAFAAKLSTQEARALVLSGVLASALLAAFALAGMTHFSWGRLMAVIVFGGAAAAMWRTNSILAVIAAAAGLVMLMVVTLRLGADAWLAMEVALMALLVAAARGAAAIAPQAPA